MAGEFLDASWSQSAQDPFDEDLHLEKPAQECAALFCQLPALDVGSALP